MLRLCGIAHEAANTHSGVNERAAEATADEPGRPCNQGARCDRPRLSPTARTNILLGVLEEPRSKSPRDEPSRQAPATEPALDQAATARESRCAPTLRLTRCRALSTVFVSHSSRSPTCS